MTITMRACGLAALLLVLAGSAEAATTTITVTTLADEDGTNPALCSLREAVKAANTRQPYGGCSAGSTFNKNLIQLDAGTYALSAAGGEISVTADVTVAGRDTKRPDQVNPLTGQKPDRVRPDLPFIPVDPDDPNDPNDTFGPGDPGGTFITAAPGQRIFNTVAALTVRDAVLNGNGQVANSNGGVIYAGSALELDNVMVKNGNVSGSTAAAGHGGAIYLASDGGALTLSDVTLSNNQAANNGGAIAMICNLGLNPYASHTVSIVRSLLKDNSSVQGAGAIELCGNTNATLTSSTLSGNSSAASSGAIAYVQGADISLGKLSLGYVTAVAQTGHVLAINGLSDVPITGSLLAFNTDTACFNPDTTPPIIPMAVGTSGNFNALADTDTSCDSLMTSSNPQRVTIPAATPLSDVLVALSTGPFGLTDYYLPKLGSTYVIDRGEELTVCSTPDQRNTVRRSGSKCDIGAVERLKVSASNDKADSSPNTDRLAIVDVLVNDTFGESDTAPYGFAENTPAIVSPPSPAKPAVVVDNSAEGKCQWRLSDATDYPGKLVVDTEGVLTGDTPVVCTYHVIDKNGDASATNTTTVTVNIKNANPVAVADVYVRAMGTDSISFNPLGNDNDDRDGKYGHVDNVASNPPDWAISYPIDIVTEPELGTVVASGSGPCPDSTLASPKTCFTPPLRYITSNNLSPFTDSFSYRVFDKDGGGSNTVTVTIATDAPDPDHDGGAGSADLFAIVLCALLGLRRARKL